MGSSITIIFVDDDDTVELLPIVQYEKLLRRDLNFKFLKYAVMRIRFVSVVAVSQAKIDTAIFLSYLKFSISYLMFSLLPEFYTHLAVNEI
jgi:hypothetical protein